MLSSAQLELFFLFLLSAALLSLEATNWTGWTGRNGKQSTRIVHVNQLQWHPSVMGAECSRRMWRDDCEEKQRSRRKGAQAQEECSGARARRVTPVSDG
jgi:hypothetical protein